MKSNVIFTIVTTNYIPLSNILGDSIKENQPNTDYKVFIADKFEPNSVAAISKYDFFPLDVLDIFNIESMAFKYNLTEFCTAIKPKCFEFLFTLSYSKIVYLDPDIYVYSDFKSIYSILDNHSICISPHILYPEENYTGYWPQGAILASGIYNLGFIGLGNTNNSKSFVKWWAKNLEDKCYNERSDGFFTDQKWIDFCPVFFPDTHIIRELGINVALWNIHEREIKIDEGKYYVIERNRNDKRICDQLHFIHFSNLNFNKAQNFDQFIPFTIHKNLDFIDFIDFYRKKLIENDFLNISKSYKYQFNHFQNGITINKIHRRLFRKLIENGFAFNDPFSTEKESFYSILKKNRLIYNSNKNIDIIDNSNDSNFSKKFVLITLLCKILVRIIGIKRYTFLCRFGLWFFKYENQIFLVKEFEDKIKLQKPILFINTTKE